MLRMGIFSMALMSGGTAAWLTTSSEPVSADAAQASIAQLDHVLVAATDIVPGARIDAAALRWQPWPQEAVSENYITQETKPEGADALIGMAVRSPVLSGEPIHLGKIAPSDAGLLSVMLPQGMRAVAVRISADTTAGGFILPNDRVDVLYTRMHQGADGQADATSRAILRRVRVLAIDQTVDADTGSVVGKTATLELRPEEAEVVVAAEAAGTITLALRSASDAHEPELASELASELGLEQEPEWLGERVSQAPATKAIRVFRGVQSELVEVRQ